MKTNFLKGLFAVAAGALMLGVTGCKKDGPTGYQVPEINILENGTVNNNLSFEDLDAADSHELTFQVRSNSDWEVTETAPEWLTINPKSGAGNKTVEVNLTVAENEGESREFDIVFENADGKSRTVTVAQLGAGEVPAEFGQGKISINGLNKLWSAGSTIPANTFIEGTVISDVAGANLDTRGFCIWDATTKNSGIQVYQLQGLTGESPQSHSFAMNSTVKVQLDGATMTTYNGLKELTNINVSAVTPVTITAITAPAEVANYAALVPEYQSMLVSMPNVKATAKVGETWGQGSNDNSIAFADAADAAFNVFIRKYSYQGFQDAAIPANTGTITGIVGYHTTYGTQIQPRNVADVEGLGQGTITPVFGVSTTAVSVSSTAGDVSVNVTGNVAWTAAIATNGANATIKSGATGTAPGTVTLTFPANTADTEKVTTVTISTTEAATPNSYTVTFTQAPAGTVVKTATFDIPNMGIESGTNWGAQTINGITITADGGGNQNTPKYYSTGTPALRTYKDNTLTFTGGTIKEISWTNGSRNDGFTVNTGTVAGTTWTGSATSVVFTTASTTVTNPQQHFTSIVVTYE